MRDAEIHHLERAVLQHEHVGGLEVPVHDLVLVRVRERARTSGSWRASNISVRRVLMATRRPMAGS